jgi:hypothetical protein
VVGVVGSVASRGILPVDGVDVEGVVGIDVAVEIKIDVVAASSSSVSNGCPG